MRHLKKHKARWCVWDNMRGLWACDRCTRKEALTKANRLNESEDARTYTETRGRWRFEAAPRRAA